MQQTKIQDFLPVKNLNKDILLVEKEIGEFRSKVFKLEDRYINLINQKMINLEDQYKRGKNPDISNSVKRQHIIEGEAPIIEFKEKIQVVKIHLRNLVAEKSFLERKFRIEIIECGCNLEK